MRILITGGRAHDNPILVRSVLNKIRDKYVDLVIAHGSWPTAAEDATAGLYSVDAVADEWAVKNDVEVWRFAASFKTLGPKAGPIRNGQMLREFKPDVCVAFRGGKGTADCVKQARGAGVRVWEVELSEPKPVRPAK